MKKTLKTTRLLLALALLSSATGIKAQSPTLQTPSNADQVQASGFSSCISMLNSTSIAYGTSGYFWGACGTTGSGVVVNLTDPALGTISVATSTTAVGQIDMVLGNNNMGGAYNPLTDYILALGYTDGAGNIVIDFYDIYDDGASTFSSSYLSTITRTPTTSAGMVRMNAVAEFGNTGITGLPFVNKFVITWMQTVGGTQNVYAAMGDLNAQTLAATHQINPAGTTAMAPDVAAIQRRVGIAMNYTAWITYIDTKRLYLTEYNFSTNTALSTITLDNGTSNSLNISQPRIAAPDNYNPLSTAAHYTVVAQVYNTSTGFQETRDYDNNLYAASTYYVSTQYIDVTSIGAYSSYAPPYIEVSPAVATQPGNFLVVQQTNVPIAGGGMAVTMEPIDPLTSAINTTPNKYFWVNGNGTPPPLPTLCGQGLAITTPLNDAGRTAIYVWSVFDPSTSTGEIDYKNPSGFAFKQAPASTTVTTESNLEVYPNPAASELTISSYIVTNTTNTYQVTDLAGRQVMSGSLTSGISKVGIGQLASGSYVLKLYKDNIANGEKIFVKN